METVLMLVQSVALLCAPAINTAELDKCKIFVMTCMSDREANKINLTNCYLSAKGWQQPKRQGEK